MPKTSHNTQGTLLPNLRNFTIGKLLRTSPLCRIGTLVPLCSSLSLYRATPIDTAYRHRRRHHRQQKRLKSSSHNIFSVYCSATNHHIDEVCGIQQPPHCCRREEREQIRKLQNKGIDFFFLKKIKNPRLLYYVKISLFHKWETQDLFLALAIHWYNSNKYNILEIWTPHHRTTHKDIWPPSRIETFVPSILARFNSRNWQLAGLRKQPAGVAANGHSLVLLCSLWSWEAALRTSRKLKTF
jgi:hypothetical protein